MPEGDNKSGSGRRSFMLRLDASKLSALEKWAADEFRSVNGQLEWLITRALSEARRLPKDESPAGESGEKQNGGQL